MIVQLNAQTHEYRHAELVSASVQTLKQVQGDAINLTLLASKITFLTVR